jgi:PAS domain S-box-containing protein
MHSQQSEQHRASHPWKRQKAGRQPLDQHHAKREQAQGAGEESEQRFRAVWEAASDAMALSTPDGTVFAANPAYYRLYGYSPEEVLGNNYSIIFPEEQRQWARELYAYVFQSPTISPSFVTPIRRADGTERIVEASYSFLTHNGTRTAMLSLIRDITERTRTEEALRESQLQLYLALKVGEMGTWEWDIVSNTIHLSANLEVAFGFAPETFSATYEACLELVYLEDRALVDQAMRHALEEGTEYAVEFRAVLPDGTIRWTKSQGQVLSDEAGKPIRMIGVLRDMTKCKYLEEGE